MRLTTNNSDQLQTIFGSGYVQEQHRDETHHNLPSTDSRAIGIATV